MAAHTDVDVAVGFETPWAKTPKFGLHLAQLNIDHDTAYVVPNVSVAFTKAFKDVDDDYWADDYIHGLAGAMITFGVPGGYYLPDNELTRAEMAVFLIRGVHGPLWKPPSAIGIFNDVTPDHWAADYIEQLYTDEITTGCIPGMPNNMWYCPEESRDAGADGGVHRPCGARAGLRAAGTRSGSSPTCRSTTGPPPTSSSSSTTASPPAAVVGCTARRTT